MLAHLPTSHPEGIQLYILQNHGYTFCRVNNLHLAGILLCILPDDSPSVVVLDELPYLMDASGSFESVLQRSWDRELSRKPVLLLLIGSDLSMMEALTSYGRPFHQRGVDMPIGPPIICARWQPGERVFDFLARELTVVVSERAVRLGELVAEHARDCQAVVAKAQTDLVWLEDRITALGTLRQTLDRIAADTRPDLGVPAPDRLQPGADDREAE
jgi:hypothetical protein